MTDNEIIKALECCKKPLSESTCVECAFYKTGRCSINMLNATLDLINRQKAEIESLKHRKTELQIRNQELQHEKSEAIKEFAKKLKENYCFTDRWGKIISISTVDNLVKEMAGDTK